MIKKYQFLSALCITLFSYTHLSAEQGPFIQKSSDKNQGSEFYISEGWRNDKFCWKIPGPHGKPNILSELSWKNLHMWHTRVGAKLKANDHYFLKGYVGYGHAYHGKVQDSDYLGNNRTKEFSRSIHSAKGSRFYEANVMIGKDIALTSAFSVAPQIGYGVFKQHFKMRKGHSIIGGNRAQKKQAKEAYNRSLHSSYSTLWHGPQVALQGTAHINKAIDLFGQYTLTYPLSYTGKGHWNLREKASRHFTQKAKTWKSFGQMFNAGVDYHFTQYLTLRTEVEGSYYKAKDGTQKKGPYKSKFGQAKSISREVRVGLVFNF